MSADEADAILRVFDEIDRAVGAFAGRSGLACPTGCGRCCHSPHVEARVAECLPLAEELRRRGESGMWHGRLEAMGGAGRCVFFVPEAGDTGRGRCSVYAFRPSLCRLFGFAGRVGKDGRRELAACMVHRAAAPEALDRAMRLIDGDPACLPVFSDYSARLAGIAPDGNDPLPINEAMRRAIERTALRDALAAAESRHADPADGPDEPPTPSSPEPPDVTPVAA